MSSRGFFSDTLNGFVDQGSEFVGELRFRDTFRVDGYIRGRVVSDQTLIVGEKGVIEGEIDCGVVSISGRVKGHIHARDRIEVLKGARVEASLDSPKLVVEEGAHLSGETTVGDGPSI